MPPATTTARLNLSTMMTVVLKYLEDNIFEVRTVTTGYPVPAGLQISPVMMLMKLA